MVQLLPIQQRQHTTDEIKQQPPKPRPLEEDSLERIIQKNKSMLRSNRYLSELLESEFESC